MARPASAVGKVKSPSAEGRGVSNFGFGLSSSPTTVVATHSSAIIQKPIR